jgi:hypothetical protein
MREPPVVQPLPNAVHCRVSVKTSEFQLVTREEAEADSVEYTPFARSSALDALQRILEWSSDEKDPAEVRLVLFGGNDLLHSVGCAYVSLLQSRPALFRGAVCRFYLLPSERSNAAAFLARWDPLYFRQVFVPFRAPQFILPWTRPEAPSASDPALPWQAVGVGPPGLLLRQLVQNYVREAEAAHPLFAIQCDAWGHESHKPKGWPTPQHAAEVCIPVFQRLEIGITVEASEHQQRRGLSQARFEDLVRDKSFIYTPPELAVRAVVADVDCEEGEAIEDEPAPYNSILLTHVPFTTRSDAMAPPAPTQRALDLSVVVAPGGGRARQRTRRPVLPGEPRLLVKSLAVVAEGAATFRVRIDGTNFGPFHSILVRPLVTRESPGHVALPLYSFCPVEPQ